MTYESIFSDVSDVSDEVSQHFGTAEDQRRREWLITLYFARIIETNQLPIRTVIMCTTGVGTSELLRVKIENEIS